MRMSDNSLKINQNTLKLFTEAAKSIKNKNSGENFLNVLNVSAPRNKFADNQYFNTSNMLNSNEIKNINVFNDNKLATINKDMTIDTVMKNNEDVSDGIINAIGKKINSIKETETRINNITSSDDIDSLDLVTSIHNLELEFKQLNMYATKIVDAVKSILYNTQV